MLEHRRHCDVDLRDVRHTPGQDDGGGGKHIQVLEARRTGLLQVSLELS